MEFKVIIYVIGGILYFFYTVAKKAEEKKKNMPPAAPKRVAPPVTPASSTTASMKPVSPPTRSAMETVVHEMKRQQADKAVQKKEVVQASLNREIEKKAAKDLFIHEKKQATFGSGANDSPIFEPTKEEMNIFEMDNRIHSESAYNLPEAAAVNTDDNATFEFDARQAFISSIIFERKY